jgi:hypothetical protein
MTILPIEIYAEILKEAKSIPIMLKYMLVCKEWKEIIREELLEKTIKEKYNMEVNKKYHWSRETTIRIYKNLRELQRLKIYHRYSNLKRNYYFTTNRYELRIEPRLGAIIYKYKNYTETGKEYTAFGVKHSIRETISKIKEDISYIIYICDFCKKLEYMSTDNVMICNKCYMIKEKEKIKQIERVKKEEKERRKIEIVNGIIIIVMIGLILTYLILKE